jgi:acyl carrier protein
MSDSEMLENLSAIMRDVLDDPGITLTRTTTAQDVPGWDSMVNITFIVEVERRFGIKFKTAEVEEMHDVGEMIDMIAAKRTA